MKKERNFYLFFLCLCLTCFSACNEEKMSEQPSGDMTTVEKIKNVIDLQGLSLPDVSLNGDKQTRNKELLTYSPDAVTPIWNSYQKTTLDDITIWMFQLKSSEVLSSMIKSYYYGKEEDQMSDVIFKLAVKQKDGKITSRIITYIPDEDYLQKTGYGINEFGYDLKSINYSGNVIVSTINGKIIFGERYENGEIAYTFCPKGNTLYNMADQAECKTIESNDFHFSFNLFTQQNISTLNHANITCPLCGNRIDQCGCMVLFNIHSKATRSSVSDGTTPDEDYYTSNWYILFLMTNGIIFEEDVPL